MNIGEKKEPITENWAAQLILLRKSVGWCILGLVSCFLTLAIAICDPVLKTTFDKIIGAIALCMTGCVFFMSVIMCAYYMVRLKKGVR